MNRATPESDASVAVELECHLREVGWTMVSGKLPGGEPYLYSVGLSRWGHPEVVVTGLPTELSQALLTRIAQRYRRDGVVRKVGEKYRDLSLAVMTGLAVEAAGLAHLRVAASVMGEDFKAVQIVWPDRAGHFPWEAGADATLRQPLLGPPPRTH